ncbi:MAG: hypothetical protein ACLSH2_05405 [Oscillospiraceae bacterium]
MDSPSEKAELITNLSVCTNQEAEKCHIDQLNNVLRIILQQTAQKSEIQHHESEMEWYAKEKMSTMWLEHSSRKIRRKYDEKISSFAACRCDAAFSGCLR